MVTDPRIERRRIAENKDDLLEGSCAWVFEDAAFKDWWEKDDIRCLWVHGDPGKGKTMMAMAIIDKIASRVKQSLRDTPGGYISYFFCQGAVTGLNDAISVLRGLIFVLVDEHPELIDPLRQALGREGTRLFEGNYGLHALWVVLQHVLEDERVPRVYLVIDALDECSGLQDSLLYILMRNVRDLPEKVKWIITSRNEPQIKRKLENNPLIHHTNLELNSDHVKMAVRKFIQVKVKDLNYDDSLRKEAEVYLTANADGTFLWVALVCQELKNEVKRKLRSVLSKFPSGLEPLYGRMLEQIEHLPDSDDREYCIRVLRITTLAYRPLHLKEFVFAADLPDKEFADSGDISDLINQCGSFLTIRDEMVYFVHQSAKDFLSSTKGYRIFCTSLKDEHRLFARRLLALMSRKHKRNICNLDHQGVFNEEINQEKVKLCMELSVQYACCHWIDHVLGKITSLLIETDHNDIQNTDQPVINDFLRECCLYWLEAMSLIGKIPKAIAMMIELESFLNVSTVTETLEMYLNVRLRRRKLLSYNPWSEIHYGSCVPLVACSLRHLFSYIVPGSSSVHLTASFGSRLAYRQQEMSRL
jgi:NACHT domain